MRKNREILGTLALCLTFAAIGFAAESYKDIIGYDFGLNRTALSAIEAELRGAGPEKSAEIEARLLATIQDPQATFACKQFICRVLRQIGTAASVPVLTPLLTDKETSDLARFAMERIVSPDVDKAFREALKKTDGDSRIGIVNSIGVRRDKKAAKDLGRMLKNADKGLTEAILRALGRIGDKECVSILSKDKTDKSLEQVRSESLLLCADRMLEKPDAKGALKVYDKLSKPGNPSAIRAAAYVGLVRAQEPQSVKTVIQMLGDDDPRVRRIVPGLIVDSPGGAETTKAYAKMVGGLAPDLQVIVLDALATRGDSAAAPEVVKLAGSDNEAVRTASIRALGSVGDKSSVEFLIGTISAGEPFAGAAVGSLMCLRGEGVEDVILAKTPGSDGSLRIRLIQVLKERRSGNAVPMLLKCAEDTDGEVRAEAIAALRYCAAPKDLPQLLDLLAKASDERDLGEWEKTIGTVARRMPDAKGFLETMASASANCPAPGRASALRILGRFGGETALRAITASVADKDEGVQDAAIRALADWKDAAPMDVLFGLAKDAPKENHRVLALRAYLRMLEMPADRPASRTAEMYEAAMGLAKGSEEKRTALAGLSRVADEKALTLAEKFTDDPDLKEDARSAYQSICGRLGKSIVIFDGANLDAEYAKIEDGPARLGDRRFVENWRKETTKVSWKIAVKDAGAYEIFLEHATPEDQAGSEYKITVGDQSVSGTVKATRDWGRYERDLVGKITVNSPGEYTLTIELVKMAREYFGNVQRVIVTKAAQ